MEWIILGVTALLGLYMAWNIGANDFANSFADAVGSRAISFRKAVIIGGVCELAGSILVGGHVTDTVRKGIVDPNQLADRPEALALGMACALLAAALWLNVSSWLSLPVSTTHSIVGAVIGFGVLAAGTSAVDWGKVAQIVLSWFISPVVGGILAYFIFRLITRAILGRATPAVAAIRFAPLVVFTVMLVVTFSVLLKGGLKRLLAERAEAFSGPLGLAVAVGLSAAAALVSWVFVTRFLGRASGLPLAQQLKMVESIFAPLVVISSASVAFAHGANDVANAVGPLAAVAEVIRSGTVRMKVVVPIWVLLLGGLGIVFGLATYGLRVLRTVGRKITELTPSRGVAADIAAAATVLFCSRLKVPVSTTHTLVGAIIGVGLARGLGGVNRRVVRHIFGSWLLTVPAAAGLSALLFLLARSAGAEELLRKFMQR